MGCLLFSVCSDYSFGVYTYLNFLVTIRLMADELLRPLFDDFHRLQWSRHSTHQKIQSRFYITPFLLMYSERRARIRWIPHLPILHELVLYFKGVMWYTCVSLY